jgi:pyridoxamine 5'-phosphate oxidase
MESLDRHEDYGQEALKETDLSNDPMEQFGSWLVEVEAAKIYEPNAFVLGTLNLEGNPSSRTVLLKGLDERGFVFYSNFESRKGQAIAKNPAVSAVFGWYSMDRQVLIEGITESVLDATSDEYFASRPHDSQVAAWSSRQSSPIASREALDAQFDQALERFADSEVPRPKYWGGYRIVPSRIEFWKGRSNRMHDRIAFQRTLGKDLTGGSWNVERLQP